MTVSTTDNVVEYVSGGPGFTVPYRFLQNTDIEAVLVREDGSSETLTPAQYTLTGAGAQDGGTLTSAYAASILSSEAALLTISRVMSPVQPTDLRNQGRYLAETQETSLDRLTMLIQQSFSFLRRALLKPIGKNYYDAQNSRIANLADPVAPQDATPRDWVSRFIADLVSNIQGPINNAANIFYQPPSGVVGYVQDMASNDLSKGVSYIAGAGRFVNSIATLRQMPKNGAQHAYVTSYYGDDKGGGGPYRKVYDTAPGGWENGGTQIVSNDGAGWLLAYGNTIDVRQFGARADDGAGAGTNSFAAIQACITWAIANKVGEVYAPGKYMIADTLVMDTGVFTQSISLFGDGSTSRIRQTGNNKDALWFSTTQFMRNSSLKDIEFYCEANAGHAVNIKFGCTVCLFENVNATVLNPSKGIYVGFWGSLAVGDPHGVFDTVWRGGDYYITPAHTVHAFDFVCQGTTFNENRMESLRCSQSGLVQFMRFITLYNSAYLTNNQFQNINFEICRGGGMLIYNARGWLINGATFWDTPTYNNHLIHFANDGGLVSIANTMIGVQRHGDSLALGVRDIFTEAAEDTTCINCYNPSTSSPSYDWNNRRVVVMGLTLSGELRDAQRTYVNYANTTTARASVQTATPPVPLQASGFLSITRNGTGSYRFTFPIPRADLGYNVQATLSQTGTALLITTTKNVAYVDVIITTSVGVATDAGVIDIQVTG